MEGEWSCYRGGHLMEREWSCYGGGQFNMRENDHVTEAVSLNGGRIDHVMEDVTLMEGEWSCYRGGQFNGGRMVMLRRWSL